MSDETRDYWTIFNEIIQWTGLILCLPSYPTLSPYVGAGCSIGFFAAGKAWGTVKEQKLSRYIRQSSTYPGLAVRFIKNPGLRLFHSKPVETSYLRFAARPEYITVYHFAPTDAGRSAWRDCSAGLKWRCRSGDSAMRNEFWWDPWKSRDSVAYTGGKWPGY